MMNQFTPPKLVLLILSMLFASLMKAQLSFHEQNTRQDIFSGIVCGVADINGDYYDDIVAFDQAKNLWLGINNGQAYFFWKKLNYTSSQSIWSVAVADIDRNGKNDIIVGGDGYGIQVFYQEADTFRHETIESSIFYSQASTFYDINKDGWIDFTICDDNAKTRIYENQSGKLVPNFNWVDLSNVQKVNEEGNYGCLWSDIDQDGDGDLYISKCSAKATDRTDPRRINLFYQKVDSFFIEKGKALGLASGEQSWTSVSGDINDDGRFDILVANHHGPVNVFIQAEDGTFSDQSVDAGIDLKSIPFQFSLEDWDNDGDLDLLSVGSEVELWLNDGKGRFTSAELKLENPNFTSLSWGDFNEDGRLDLYTSYAGLINNPSIVHDKMWLNDSPVKHWISLGLNGKSSNKNGVGAIIYIYTNNKVQIREVQSGTSYGLQKSLNVHFGLGTSNRIDSIFIHWPSGIVDRYFDFPVDEFYLAGEGSCITPRTKINPRGIVNLCQGEEIELISYINYNGLEWNTGSHDDTIRINKNGSYFFRALNRFNCPIVSENTTLLVDPEEKPRLNFSGEKIMCVGDTLLLKANSYSNLYWNTKEQSESIVVKDSGLYFAKYEGLCKDFYSDSVHVQYNEEAMIPTLKADSMFGPGFAKLHSDNDQTLWYNEIGDQKELGEGKNFITERINSERSFFARTYSKSDYKDLSGGMKSPIYDGGAYAASFLNPTMYFDAYRDFILDSITVFTDRAGERIFELRLKVDTSLVQSIAQVLNIGKNRIYLGFKCKENQTYGLTTNSNSNITNFGYKSPRLERSNLGFNFPFIIGDACKISTSEYGDTYFYHFFDWKIHLEPHFCYSDYIELPVKLYTTSNNNKKLNHCKWEYKPEQNEIIIDQCVSKISNLIIYNLSGQEVRRSIKLNYIKTNGIKAGLYFITLSFSDGSIITEKVWLTE